MKKQILILFVIVLSAVNVFAQIEVSDEFQAIEVDAIVIKTDATPDTILVSNAAKWQLFRRNEFGRWENWTPTYWDSIKVSEVIHDSIVANLDANGSLMWRRDTITSTNITVTYPAVMSSSEYYYDVKCNYVDTVAGRIGILPNPAWGFEFTKNGFTGNVKYPKGYITWYVIRSENLSSLDVNEVDPVFTNSISSGITEIDTSSWNEKPTAQETGLAIRDSLLKYLTLAPDTNTIGISSFQFKPAGTVPDSANAAGNVGQMVVTPMYWYVCTQENSWSVFTSMPFPGGN